MAASQGRKVVRQVRERELVKATRALFDERGMQDAPIEEIARAVGIARGLIYRQFSSKEELFVLTVTDYLDELCPLLQDARESSSDPAQGLASLMAAYARYCEHYPAFLDCQLSLMHRPATELREMVSEAVWLRLGRGMASCLNQVAEVLRAGAASGAFEISDPDYMANFLWTQALGAMNLARIRVGVRQAGNGLPDLFPVAPEDIVSTCVASALATAGARPRTS